ncbi:hypothetical protein EJB05_06351, partial [Eragrostis curvula]
MRGIAQGSLFGIQILTTTKDFDPNGPFSNKMLVDNGPISSIAPPREERQGPKIARFLAFNLSITRSQEKTLSLLAHLHFQIHPKGAGSTKQLDVHFLLKRSRQAGTMSETLFGHVI